MKHLLDSNIIIYHLNGEKIASDFLSDNISKCAIS
ncbi:putative nucleic acid-binding protein [Desulfosalsimonas propionicica]|uniref:Putative nucleic acid-binding protein n=1 Tax=Desulfosalsimonas propionicica TaxID=332175 RepID=A0A7W0CBG4_9BACT|nr:putative nucleic acid-binding protein [Desulfosalsimonas propionicica]